MPNLGIPLGFEEKILEEAIQSPSIAMMRLSLEIDRQLRLILAVIGRLKEYFGQSPSDALDLIAKSNAGNFIPSELRDTLNNFWDLRNVVVHGGRANDNLSMRSVDYGLRILRMLQAIPRPSFIVIAVVNVFSDRMCTVMRQDVRGVILESFGPNGEKSGTQIHPSRREYTIGQSVSWEWDLAGNPWESGWGETWYRDPDSGEIKLAWSQSLEFIGRPLELI
ncbi:MAG: hypothetical protein ABSD72_16290 [Terracidiphilus sp.]|jgi:hypothetical protein